MNSSIIHTKKTILLSIETKDKLTSIGKKSQTYDDIIDQLLNHVDTCDRFWEARN